MNAQQKNLLDKLRNSLAEDKLMVVTGAGVSVEIESEKGGLIPSWGGLVASIKSKAKKEISGLTKEQKSLLSRLTPDGYLDYVHGDALIEASELIEGIVNKNQFSEWIAEETKEKEGEKGPCHDYIAEIQPRGLITFNYDQCHENAFYKKKVAFNKVLYSDGVGLRRVLKTGFQRPTFILKAHGCVSDPKSLVLTSSSYSRILNEQRAYRAVMQHILTRYTILIVGFALRDRDFDQILMTIERDYGSSVQDHIAIMKTIKKSSDPEQEKNRHKNIADFAALEARYGLKVLTVNEYDEIPRLIRSIKNVAGSQVRKLVEDVASVDPDLQRSSRGAVIQLSVIGKAQFKKLLINKISTESDDLDTRSELIYSLGLLKSKDIKVIDLLVQECEKQSQLAEHEINKIGNIECIAHALVAFRGTTVLRPSYLKHIKGRLFSNDLMKRLISLDSYLQNNGDQPRLVDYLKASFSEVYERSSYYSKT